MWSLMIALGSGDLMLLCPGSSALEVAVIVGTAASRRLDRLVHAADRRGVRPEGLAGHGVLAHR